MLIVKNLHASVEGKTILKGVDLQVNKGEIHAIMGPNASGKSTFAKILAGHEDYEITAGKISFEGQDLSGLLPEERAHRGIFLAFQYPLEIPGVNNMYFLKESLNAIRKARGEKTIDAPGFIRLLREKLAELNMDEKLLKRSVNTGFSGGEMKRNEILQMTLLEPKLAILDETDSGLDIDALRAVAEGVNKLRSPDRAMIIVTHYQRLLDYIEPDYVHVMADGKLIRSGDKTLAHQLEEKGYRWIVEGQAA